MDLSQLHNYTVVSLDPIAREPLEMAFATHDLPHPDPCALCGRRCWGKVCSACKGACAHAGAFAGYKVLSNGGLGAAERCLTCGTMLSAPARGRTIYELCLRNNLERSDFPVPPCARCGATTGTERHHWAPRAIFNDADSWPMVSLCPTCHRTWHRAMRAAKGVSLTDANRVGDVPTWLQALA